MKKILVLLCVSCLSFCVNTQAQPAKKKAEEAFLKELNSILYSKKDDHWWYNGEEIIDTAFYINQAGIISVTKRYTEEDGRYIRIRSEAPVNKIKEIAYDLYHILDYKSEEVTLFESEYNDMKLIEKGKSNYLHIGVTAMDGYKQKKRLEKLLKDLLKYYP